VYYVPRGAKLTLDEDDGDYSGSIVSKECKIRLNTLDQSRRLAGRRWIGHSG
jgi:hypothetical protein